MFGLLLIPVFWQRSSRLNYLYSFICPLNTRTLFSLKPHFFCLAVFFPRYIFFMFYILSIFSSTRNFSKNSHNPYVFTVYEDFISISPYLSEPDFSEDDGSWIFIKLQFPFKWQYIQNLWIDFIVLGKVENVKKLTNDERQLRIKVN